MSHRVRYTLLTIPIVSAMFVLYRFAVAPWIDPETVLNAVAPAGDPAPGIGVHAIGERLEPFQLYFPPGSWERENPIILESEGAKFIIRDYETLKDGRVKLSKCSIFFLPAGDVDFANPQKRLILLQAPEGAILEFDTPIDLARFKVGRLIGGQMMGKVRVRGTPSRPGADDELDVLTQDVQTNEKRLWTPAPVVGRLGPHQLSGTELNIRWLPAESAGAAKKGPNVGGIESLELVRDVRMLLQPGAGGLLPGDRAAQSVASTNPAAPSAPQPPVEIRCRGSLHYLPLEFHATFEDQVEVLRLLPVGITDRLTGDTLRIDFQERTKSPTGLKPLPQATTSKDKKKNPALEPRRIIVTGNPARVRAPSSLTTIDAEHLEYDLVGGRVVLDGKQEIHLKQSQNEYHGKTISYEPGVNGGLGKLAAVGPGWMRAVPDDAKRGPLEIVFTESLKMRPHERNHVVSILGQARVKSALTGELAADEIHLWLLEIPRAANAKPAKTQGDLLGGSSANAIPERLMAAGSVAIQTPQLRGNTKRLEIWFDPAGQAAAEQKLPTDDVRVIPLSRNEAPPPTLERHSPTRASATDATAVATAPSKPDPSRRYDVQGELIRVQLLSRGGQSVVEDLTIDGGVTLLETNADPTAPPGMNVVGDHLEVLEAGSSKTQITIKGNPAKVASRGLETFGEMIRVDREKNRIWIENAGRVFLPESERAAPSTVGTPAPNAAATLTPNGPTTIDFNGGLDFDGRQITITKDVLVTMNPSRKAVPAAGKRPSREFRTVRTQQIVVTLATPIDLRQPPRGVNGAPPTEVETLACRGGFVLETREDDLDGLPLSWQQLQALDLLYSPLTGALSGTGPGELTGVRRGKPSGISDPNIAPDPTAPDLTASDELQYLHIDYRRGFRGNMQQRLMTFDNQIKAVSGAVPGWADRLDPDAPEKLGPRGMVLTCEQLILSESLIRTPGARPALELQAIDNAIIEGGGGKYTGRGYRLTYAQDKDRMTLEGDGRAEAVLNYQQVPGAPLSKASAARLTYYPQSQRVDVEGGRMIDLEQAGGASNPKKK